MAISADHAVPLYEPQNADEARVFHFLRRINAKYGLQLESYADLYEWSTSKIDDFWGSVWDETEIIGHKGTHVVGLPQTPASNPPWFTEAKLNWAENMLRCRSADKIALIQATEPTPHVPSPALRRVLAAVGWRRSQSPFAPCLAATALGCIWVSAAADFGPEGVLERFEQVQPAVVFAVDAVVYNAKVHAHLPKVSTLLAGLHESISLHPKVIIIETNLQAPNRQLWDTQWVSWDDFVHQVLAQLVSITLSVYDVDMLKLPVVLLGRPKPIVHRSGGMLLQAKKEFLICADLQPEDVFFYYTTTFVFLYVTDVGHALNKGWMMWNFLTSALSVGCTLVLYDGSPLRDPAYLWKLTDELRISIFGTSAKYLDQLSKGYKPREHHDLSSLRHVYSTGSPLAPSLYDYVYRDIHPKVLLASITGRSRCAKNDPGEPGELVCVQPFPCMPLGFWPLAGFGPEEAVKAAAARYQESYFSEYKDIWYHGDHVVITPSRAGNAGGLIMLGRSDGVLNPGGVRFGSAEIYEVVEMCFSPSTAASKAHTIVDCLAVGQSIDGNTDERVVLFVQLVEGELLSADLEKLIKTEVRTRRSPRHVPSKIVQVQDIPYTLNGKRVEVPVKKLINGAAISTLNPSTLRNPECLAAYVDLRETVLKINQ
ncbi:hypothetical protein HWV62_7166 [Athelia sp. TMB]|nr:hypothetical protein HWV62_7166 [Athelia sp. TMB]